MSQRFRTGHDVYLFNNAVVFGASPCRVESRGAIASDVDATNSATSFLGIGSP
jgi:hypothetical protein